MRRRYGFGQFLIHTTCRRCGKSIVTGRRALIGTPEMKARYGELCADCFTPEEYEAMDQDFRHLIFGR